MKFSSIEPSDRPFMVGLSHAEIVVLIRYHAQQTRRIPKVMGQMMMKENSKLMPRSRAIKEIHETAKQQMEAHHVRAKGLLSILPK
jgi:hypothetical protein